MKRILLSTLATFAIAQSADAAGLSALDLSAEGGASGWGVDAMVSAEIGGVTSLRLGAGYTADAVREAHLTVEALLAPTDAGRLALFGRYTDLDDDPRAYGVLGAAFAIAPDTGGWLTVAAEIGGGNFVGLDWFGGRVSYWRPAGETVSLGTQVSLTEIDEGWLDAWLWQVEVGADWRPAETPLVLFARIGVDGLAGHDPAPPEATFSVGLRWHLGAPDCLTPAPDALAPLFRRGLL